MNIFREIDKYVYSHVKERQSFCKCGYNTGTTKRRLNDIVEAVLGSNAVYFQIKKKVLVMRDADTDEILETDKAYPVVGLDDETWFIKFCERWQS